MVRDARLAAAQLFAAFLVYRLCRGAVDNQFSLTKEDTAFREFTCWPYTLVPAAVLPKKEKVHA